MSITETARTLTGEEWRLRAACRDADPTLFFPDRAEEARPARAVCHSCPVRQTCLDYALTIPDLDGIWGGKSSSQRARMRQGVTDSGRAARTHCKREHEFTPENTRIDRSGHRVCRTCAADNQRRHRERRTARAAS